MNLNFSELLPEQLSDKDATNLASILMKLALEFEKQHYSQISRYYKALERDMKNTQMQPELQDDEYPF